MAKKVREGAHTMEGTHQSLKRPTAPPQGGSRWDNFITQKNGTCLGTASSAIARGPQITSDLMFLTQSHDWKLSLPKSVASLECPWQPWLCSSEGTLEHFSNTVLGAFFI